jgi:hypothetical protein
MTTTAIIDTTTPRSTWTTCRIRSGAHRGSYAIEDGVILVLDTVAGHWLRADLPASVAAYIRGRAR